MKKTMKKSNVFKIVALFLAVVTVIGLFGSLIDRSSSRPSSRPSVSVGTSGGENGIQVLGFTGLTDPSGNLTWTDDIASASAYTQWETGVYVNVTSPLDDMFPFCEIEEFTDDKGNVFVKFPKCYIKYIKNADGYLDGFKVSNVMAEEGMFIPDCFLDPSDSEGASYLDYFALGKYEMSGYTDKGYSKSGQTCLVHITRGEARTAARSYGDSLNYYNGYQLQDYSMTVLYNFLCMTYYKTANIQKVYVGRTSYGSSWSSAAPTGTTDPIEGLNGWSTVTDCVKMLGIENPYGNVSKWVDGICFTETKSYVFRLPHLYSDDITGANIFSRARFNKSGHNPRLMFGSTRATQGYVLPVGLGDSSGNADYYTYSDDGKTLSVGGHWSSGVGAGLWCLDSGGVSYSNGAKNYIGARLAFRPLY